MSDALLTVWWAAYQQGMANGRAESALKWRKLPPIPADLNGRSEEYFWIRGGDFNRPLIVRANNGVNSEVIDDQRVFRAEVNFQFFADGYPETIWSSELRNWPWLLELEWAGPVERVPDNREKGM